MAVEGGPAQPTLSTARLTLRPIRHDDVDLLVRLDADPEVVRYLTGGRPSTPEQVRAVVDWSIGHRWIAQERGTGVFVGWFELRPTADGERELGYRLVRRAWGQGLATEGALALLDLAFSVLGVGRVWAETMAVNRASRAVMERIGMRHVRTLRKRWDEPIEGSEHGEVEYEITREEWLARGRGG